MRADVSAGRLRSLLTYDPETGVFTYRVSRGPVAAGREAGCIGNHGYRLIIIDGRQYVAHRLAWLWVTGEWPAAEIDHRNLVKDDNRWANLREATHRLNHMNSPRQSNNTSGFKGVSPSKSGRRWQARISVNGCVKRLGSFATPLAAHEAYVAAANRHYGDFARAS